MAAKSCCIRDIEVVLLQSARVEYSELFLQGSTIFVSTSMICSAVLKYVGIDGLSSDYGAVEVIDRLDAARTFRNFVECGFWGT